MPLYEYQCEACGKRFETIQKFSDPPVETCRVCGKGPVQRLLSSPAIQFKGSGWYITDYAKKSSSDSGSAAKSSDAGSSETKTDSGAKTKTETAAKSESTASTTTPATPKE